jgi:glycerophosphoryl diester phosphodiesterase
MDSTRIRPLLREWRAVALADLVYKAIAFAALTPLTVLLLRWLIERTGRSAVADVDIALFLFTTRAGAAALILVSALIIGVTALEQASLMTLILAAHSGKRLRLRDAFGHAARHAFAILRVSAWLVVRLLAVVAPFAAAGGLAYWALLTGHDINYYLSARPPAFWGAVAIVLALVAALACVAARLVLNWLLVLPLVVFENVLPVSAFAASARRMEGRRKAAAFMLAAWAVLAIALPALTTGTARMVGRAVAPAFSGALPRLLLFVSGWALCWGAATLAVAIVTAALFAWIVVDAYAAGGAPSQAVLPEPSGEAWALDGRRLKASWRLVAGALVALVLLTTGAAYFVMRNAWTDRTVIVFAHRGASEAAPENTLAAFRLAGREHADYVELDVQESADGVVFVVHDADLMKVGGSPLKIWESTAEQLRQVDIGSRAGPQFKDERLPTLAEALEACKGVTHVDIELKYYGHDQRLEERVVELVEAAGMEKSIVTMSLNRDMVAKMKRLRPSWTSGLLSAKAIGDLSGLPVDFLAVEKSMATRRFIRAAHRAGKPVYLWTVDDPARMIRAIGLGADGIITDRPDIARDVVDRYARMTEAERLFLFVMTTLGAEHDAPPPEPEQRP